MARAIPVPEPDGSRREWIGFIVDRTERRRAREVADALQAALDSERRILEAVVDQAPTGVAVLWGPEHRYRFFNERYVDLVPEGRIARGRAVREALPEAGAVIPLLDRARAGETLQSRDFAVRFDDERSFGGHRYYDISYTPLLEAEGPGGVLILVTETTEEVRRRQDLERRLDEERRRAEELQHALLPEVAGELPGLEVAVRYLPGAEGVSVGGDWYDVVPLDEGRVAIVIGDVGGRGIGAARVMGQLRSALRAYLVQDLEPAAALTELARLCARLDLSDMVTAGIGVLDLRDATMTYANAGHLPPLIWRADGGVELAAVHRGIPIGAPDPSFEDVVLDLPAGSVVALYTDGLVEKRTRSLADTMEELRGRAEGLESAPEERADELLRAVRTQGLDDDVALLVCRTGVPVVVDDAGSRFTGRFAGEPRSIALIRHGVGALAVRGGFDRDAIHAVHLAVTEAATNAIVHAYEDREGDLEVTARLHDDELEVVVADSGPGLAPRADSPGLGFGLPLMAGLATRMDLVQRDPGTAVHLVFRRTVAA
jgi:anti-sigma regulatory factor (Ser/Thr protein kinase)